MQKKEKNAFGILRYWAAFCVMCLHFTGYMRIYVPDHAVSIGILRSAIDFYQPTVILFAISGFLISASLERSGLDVKLFMKKRFFRLYPELWLSMAVYLASLFLIIPDKFDISILRWIVTQGIGFAATPSCMQKFATGSINGPLWYITVLLQLYILLFLFKLVTKNSKSPVLYGITCFVLSLGNIAAFILRDMLSSTGQKLLERCFIPYAVFFFIGAFCQTCSLYNQKYTNLVLAVLLMLHSLIRITRVYDYGYYTGLITGMATAAIAVLAAHVIMKEKSVRLLETLEQKARKTDITYGMYLYHWLFLNLLIHFKLYEKYHWSVCLLGFTAATLLFAYASRKICSSFTK
ncbi:acyltransferase family protein [Butyrivibrio sp. AC2005]|uniref:acyltransferase family protein n=1 Tax=Butyrivibrio sp. AC2005 TaxID=1280672 RepID=UPI000418D471|nr:acyltransferase family protein [Butyrivibrio sp. AC2005]